MKYLFLASLHTVHLKQSGAFDCHILRSSEPADDELAPVCARSVIVVPLIQRGFILVLRLQIKMERDQSSFIANETPIERSESNLHLFNPSPRSVLLVQIQPLHPKRHGRDGKVILARMENAFRFPSLIRFGFDLRHRKPNSFPRSPPFVLST
jgi:hypothetical protein